MLLEIDIFQIILTSVIGLFVAALWGMMVGFIKEQRKVNRANIKANRSLQEAQLIALFHKVVELQEEITIEEFNAGKECYDAYHANGGNGAGTQMWERIRECARIRTGL